MKAGSQKIYKSYTVFKGFFDPKNEFSLVFAVSVFHLIRVLQWMEDLAVGDFFELEEWLFRWVGLLIVSLLFHCVNLFL